MFSLERMLKIWEKYGHMYWNGLGYTLLFAFVSVLMGLVLGLVLASGRMASVQSRDNLAVKALKAVAKFFCTAYVEVFRATPMLVQVFIIYYGLGNVFKLPDSSLNRMFWGMVAVGLNSAAYMSEVIRSGIQAVDPGQREAALSLGFSETKTMWFVIVPQAVKNILPALGNEFIMIIKDTSLASTFFIGDLMTKYLVVKGATMLPIEPLIIVGVIYFIMTFTLSKVFGHFERKMQRSDRRGSAGRKSRRTQEAEG